MTAYKTYSGQQMKTTVASLNGSVSLQTLTLTLGSTSYTPLGFTISESYSLFITKNSSQTATDFWIGYAGPTNLYGYSRNYTSGYALRDYDTQNGYAKVYYSKKASSSSTDSTLYTEVVNMSFSTISSWNDTVEN